MDDQKKDNSDPKSPPQRNCSKLLQTNSVPTYHVEYTNCANKGINLRNVNQPWIVPREIERKPQVDQKHRSATPH